MNNLLGKWKLLENKSFDDFLKFTKIPWYQRKVAAYSSINLSITQEGCSYVKSVKSTFYNTLEKIVFDDNYITSGSTRKKYSYVDGSVLVDVIGSIVNWRERIYYEYPNLIVEYIWEEDCKERMACQVFKP